MFVGAFQRGVETARAHVPPNLAIPRVGDELLEPFGKTGKLVRRKTEDDGLKLFNAHGPTIRSSRLRKRKDIRRIVARSANTIVAVGDEQRGTHGQDNKTEKPRSGVTKPGAARSVAPLRGSSAFAMIRGFLEDSSPTATVVLALRASRDASFRSGCISKTKVMLSGVPSRAKAGTERSRSIP